MKTLIFAALVGVAFPATAQSQAPWPHDDGWVEPYPVYVPVDESRVYVSTSMPDVAQSDYWLDFEALDRNGDGRLSRSEVSRPAPSHTTSVALANLAREFRAMDVNGSGHLERFEVSGWL